MTPEQFSKLPKFAQERIQTLERERDVAIRALNQYCDSQTPSPFSIDEHESTGETTGPSTKVRYVDTHQITVTYGGIVLDVSIKPWQKDDHCIRLQWGTEDMSIRHVAMVPVSFQQVELISKENMR